MKIEFFTIDELNYFKEHCDFTEDELYLLDEKSKGKTLEETGFDIDTLKSVKRKIRKALEDRETKTTTVEDIKEYIDEQKSIAFLVKDDEVLSTESVVATLNNISSMLDELEPNTISQAIKVIENEEEKLKFDVDKHQVDSCIFEIRNILGLGAKENNK